MGRLTWKNAEFFMDGEPFLIISGAIHYFRVPREYWHDRLLKLKECGFNTVETYTCWNLHERRQGEFDFSGGLDIDAFVAEAQSLGLYVILRPGPYICAEWDFGGLPSWLLKYPHIDIRCMNEDFLALVKKYYTELLGRLRDRFSDRGGNIIMLQIENEYGSYGNDKEYLRKIRSIYTEMGIDCLFFTSDGPCNSMLNGGTLPDALCVANFGSDPEKQLAPLRDFRPGQPLMCGEFWNGWFDYWGEKHHTRDSAEVVRDFKTFIDNNWSINMYMFHGGTNFAFTNGANYYGALCPTVTSYDYGALLSEAGDRTQAYYACRDLLVAKYGDRVPPLSATESRKAGYGRVELVKSADLLDQLSLIASPIETRVPRYMEDIGQDFGYILYRARLSGPSDPWKLCIDHVHDRAWIFVDGEYRATYVRDHGTDPDKTIAIPLQKGEEVTLDILVENMGRINYGPYMRDRKGLEGVRFENQQHFGWQMYPLPMEKEQIERLCFATREGVQDSSRPTFLCGTLKIDEEPADTFIRLDTAKKGFVMINGHNIGRYWEIGPQKTLYVPAPMLRRGDNEIIVFDSEGSAAEWVEFCKEPQLG